MRSLTIKSLARYAKKMIKRLIPHNDEEFYDRIIKYMNSRNFIDQVEIDIVKDVAEYQAAIEKTCRELFILSNSDNEEAIDSLVQHLTTHMEFFEKEFVDGLKELKTLNELFYHAVDAIRLGKYSHFERIVCLTIRLYGLTKGNPLLRMNAFKANNAWKNGSIDGYPFILILDSLKSRNIQSSAKTSRVYSESNNYITLIAEYAYTLLRHKNITTAKTIFSFAMDKVFANTETRKYWNDAFLTVSALFEDDHELAIKNLRTNIPPDSIQSERKLFVSGMGWSGSGAVYDYFKDFEGIIPIELEFQHFSGIVSLRTVRKSSASFLQFRSEILRFFSLTLLGLASYSNYQEYRTLISSHKISISDSDNSYSKHMRDVCVSLILSYDHGKFCTTYFKNAEKYLFTSFCKKGSLDTSKAPVYLFDNIIKAYRMEELAYIENAELICVYRDPRSNFVALCKESLKFVEDRNDFIREYGSKREMLESAYSKLKLSGMENKVHFVQFEDFVSSQEFRKDLTIRTGLTMSNHLGFNSFRPEISQKNILNYTEHKNQRDLKIITKRLARYIWKSNNVG